MSAPSVLTQAPRESPAAPSDLRLQGRWLLLARVGGGALAAVFVGLYVVSLPPYVAFLQTPCRGAACGIDGALTPAAMHALHQLGLPLGSYSALVAALYGVRVLVGCAIGGVIAWRRSEDGMALFVALFLITNTFGNRDTAPDVLSFSARRPRPSGLGMKGALARRVLDCPPTAGPAEIDACGAVATTKPPMLVSAGHSVHLSGWHVWSAVSSPGIPCL